MTVPLMRVLDRRTPSRTVHIFNRNSHTQLGPSVVIHLPLLAGLSFSVIHHAEIFRQQRKTNAD
jgi:hypothetical protein